VCYVIIDFTPLLTDLETYREGLIDEKDFELHAAIELLNTVGHYRHYFQSRDAEHVVVIGFVRDGYIYEKHQKILDMFYSFTNYFPNIYMIPNIMECKSSLTLHVVATVVNYMKSVSPAAKTKYSSIYVISSINSDRQLMCLFPTKVAVTIYKGYGFSATTFLYKEDLMKKILKSEDNYKNFRHKAELEYMNVLIGKYLNSVRYRNSRFDSVKINYKRIKTKDKLELLNYFIEKCYDPSQQISICNQFVLYLQGLGEIDSAEGTNALMQYESYFDYRFHHAGKMNEIIIPLFNTWKKKIKDYAISRQSENFKILQSHLAYINWLM
jgi:hypothetical protein